MTNELSIIKSYADVELAAKSMAASGYFQDARDAAQAVVKILAGSEMGFGPFASMTGVYIIQGRPSIGANLMAAAVKNSKRYNYRVIEMTDIVCEIAYFEGKEEIGRSRFTLEDARKAGTKNLDKFPRNMLFARAMSNGVRWFTPDVFAGAAVYTPEELGADVNESGDVIDIQAATVKVVELKPAPVEPEPAPAMTPAAESISYEDACKELNANGITYGDLDNAKLSYMLRNLLASLKTVGQSEEEITKKSYKRDAIIRILNERAKPKIDPA
jgi:hypothetical protein